MDEETAKAIAQSCNDVAQTLMNAVSAIHAANSGNEKARQELPANHQRLAVALMTWSLTIINAIKPENKITIARAPMPGKMN